MKVVRATYFLPNGRFHKEDTFFIPEKLTQAEALTAIPEKIDEPDMFVYVEDSRDGKEPFLMPHLFKPGAQRKAREKQAKAKE